MLNRRRHSELIAGFIVWTLLFGSSAAGLLADSDVPRYWLKVGQELSYRTSSEFSTADGQAIKSESTWQVWVVKQNADGSLRLILRHAASLRDLPNAAKTPAAKTPTAKAPTAKTPSAKTPSAKTPSAKTPSAKTPATKSPVPLAGAAKPAPEKAAPNDITAKPAKAALRGEVSTAIPEQVTFAYCDISPDGAVAPNPTLGFQFELRQLLPKLPKTDNELDKGWTDVDKATQVSYRYRVEEGPEDDDDEQRWTILATRQSPVDDIYLSRSQSTFVFDGDRGAVERIESKLDQGYGLKGTGTTSTELAGVEQFDAAWCKKLDEEMDLYFGAQRRYQALLRAAERNSSEAETLLFEAGALLQKAAADIILPVVKEDLRKQAAQHAATIGRTARAARDRADLIDQPAPTWQTKDLQGNAHTLRDNKGKVVVLHFWRRGDGWSLRALPQVEQVAERFADKPVAVLGMNTDASEEDARLVADKMGLAYPILRADKFADKYNATAASEVIVIDQKGMVRDIYVGYSPTLRDDVAGVVAELLAEK